VRSIGIAARSAGFAIVVLLATPAAALASGPHVMLAPAFLGPIGGLVGGVFHAIAGVVLGGLNWTVGVAGKFILNTIGGLIRLLIPQSWAKDGLEVFHWIVAVPDYAGTITSPSGQTVYGFAGINALRDLFTWVGAALLPFTLVYATSRAALGAGGPVAGPIGRVLALCALLASYPWWWSQAAALVNQLTHFILAMPPVTHGVYKLMQYAVGGVALGGWQLIDLALMGAIGVALLGLIFMKVVIVLLGALMYAIGPLMIALVPTEGGVSIARAWAAATGVLVILPVAWCAILAVGALLINDSATAGPLIAGSGTIASLLGGLLLALAGLAALWLCLRAAREAATIVRGQLAGALVIGRAGRGGTASTQPAQTRRAAESVRSFGSRVRGATTAALGADPAGGAISAGASAVARTTRSGLLGAGGSLVRTGARAGAPGTAALVGRTRAGAAAVRMARAGTASWQTSSATSRSGAATSRAGGGAAAPQNGAAATGGAPRVDRTGGRPSGAPGNQARERAPRSTGGGPASPPPGTLPPDRPNGTGRGSTPSPGRGTSPTGPRRVGRRKPPGKGT
jgi:hypothetical protein